MATTTGAPSFDVPPLLSQERSLNFKLRHRPDIDCCSLIPLSEVIKAENPDFSASINIEPFFSVSNAISKAGGHRELVHR